MSEKEPDKYEKVQLKIEKTISPYIVIKIPMPDGVDKGAFLKLECDKAFAELIKNQTREWLTGKKNL